MKTYNLSKRGPQKEKKMSTRRDKLHFDNHEIGVEYVHK